MTPSPSWIPSLKNHTRIRRLSCSSWGIISLCGPLTCREMVKPVNRLIKLLIVSLIELLTPSSRRWWTQTGSSGRWGPGCLLMVETSSNYINQKKVKRDIKKREKAEKKFILSVCVLMFPPVLPSSKQKKQKRVKKKHKKMKRGKKPDIKKKLWFCSFFPLFSV